MEQKDMEPRDQNFSKIETFYKEVSPATSYILYCISWLAGHLTRINTKTPTEQDKHMILLLAKTVLLCIDSILLVCCTTAYISYIYSAYKKQLQCCYMGIIVLAPSFFLKDYLHLDFGSIGYHILFLIVFAYDHSEFLIVGALSGLLVNFHKSYWLVVPFILVGLSVKTFRERFTRELGPQKIITFCTDLSQIIVAFVIVYLALTSPWFLESDDIWQSLQAVIVEPLKQTTVGLCDSRMTCLTMKETNYCWQFESFCSMPWWHIA